MYFLICIEFFFCHYNFNLNSFEAFMLLGLQNLSKSKHVGYKKTKLIAAWCCLSRYRWKRHF